MFEDIVMICLLVQVALFVEITVVLFARRRPLVNIAGALDTWRLASLTRYVPTMSLDDVFMSGEVAANDGSYTVNWQYPCPNC